MSAEDKVAGVSCSAPTNGVRGLYDEGRFQQLPDYIKNIIPGVSLWPRRQRRPDGGQEQKKTRTSLLSSTSRTPRRPWPYSQKEAEVLSMSRR
jgi:hypothetical protein